MNPYTNNILEYVSFPWKHEGILVRAPKIQLEFVQAKLGISKEVELQLLCLHQMLNSAASRLLLTAVGAAWIWHFPGFWLLEGQAKPWMTPSNPLASCQHLGGIGDRQRIIKWG